VITPRIPGTGLRRSIVRAVVEQVGARIGVVSRAGAGSSFTVKLPASRGATDQPVVRDTRATQVVLETPTDAAIGVDGERLAQWNRPLGKPLFESSQHSPSPSGRFRVVRARTFA